MSKLKALNTQESCPGTSAGASAHRVLVIIGSLDRGGSELHLLQVLPRLIARGIAMEVFSLRGGGELEEKFRAAAIPVHVGSIRGGVLGLIGAAWRLRRAVRRQGGGIVHFYLPAAYILGVLCTLGLPDLRLVMSRRSLAKYQAKYPGIAALERYLHRRMHAVLGVSQAVITELEKEGIPKERLSLIYNGIDIATLHPPSRTAARRALELPHDALILVIVANLIPYKGHALLLNALARVAHALPSPWRLLCCGRDDGLGTELGFVAQRLGLAGNVLWCGSVRDVAPYLAAADIGVLPSDEEGFSNALLEGMAQALPMVVTAVGGNPEAVIHGETGLVVTPGDAAALAAGILELAQDSERRRSLGAAGRLRVQSHFDINATIDSYAEIYANLAMRCATVIPNIARPQY